MRRWLGLLLAFLWSACGEEAFAPDPLRAPPPVEVTERPTESVDAILARLDGQPFDVFVREGFEARLAREPEWVSALGLGERLATGHRWLDDLSPAFAAETHRLARGLLDRLRTYPDTALSEPHQVLAKALRWYLEDEVRLQAFFEYDYLVHHLIGGAQLELVLTFEDLHPFDDVEDARAYVFRLRQVSSKLAQVLEGLRRRADRGIILPRRLIDDAVRRTGPIVRSSAQASGFYQTFRAKSQFLVVGGLMTEAERADLLVQVEAILEEQVLPAYARLVSRLQDLRGSAPARVGVGTLPDGPQYYAAVLRHHTTTNLSADEIHERGRRLLAAIHAEMRRAFDALGYDSSQSFQALYARVARASESLRGRAVTAEYERILRAAEARLSDAFDVRPRTPWRVVGGSSGGFYVAPSLDGARPGAFYARTTGAVTRFGMPTLAYHEVVPGHHFQIALAQEQDLPLFLKVVRFTGATEGWALYAERLAAELGWYRGDALGDLGRLQFEAFRAARLVVDTGLHVRGWSFEQARNFLSEATGFGREMAAGQVARYAAWPGQATAYTVGMQEILRLRQGAREALGERFSLPAFHREVLLSGALPLEVLEGKVAAWVERGR